jgi:MOSC domain-containing protein
VSATQRRRGPNGTGLEIGRVAAVYRYPVKSMGAERLPGADVSWHGIAGDRRWAFIRDGVVRSGFPWLTLRERPEMRAYTPSFLEPARPDESPTVVRTPGGDRLDVADPALAAELGEAVRVIKMDRGVFDVMPLSLITTQSIAAIGAHLGSKLDVQRFRPNLLVDSGIGADYPEDSWVGSTLSIGGLRIRVDQRDKRCVAVNIDPETDRRDPAILRAIADERQACLGVYGSIIRPGRVSTGDAVVIAE